ncbi:aldo/keto reductase [Chloroflexia bacterium SDU3-3]|nr:aldo/keto reductase [Chloroflexia bacterium SDU3-3]
MQYVNLGKTGLKVSRICLGTMTYGTPEWRPWALDEESSRPLIKRAVELGINFFDTADFYSLGVSEQILGRALKEYARRDQVVVATKVCLPVGDGPNDTGLSRKHIMDSIDASLRRLQTDYVDLYQIHRFDPDTPMEETMEALNDLVRAGKVRYLGASSMYAWQFASLQFTAEKHGWSKFVSMQNHYNLVYREEEREMNPFCRATGVGLIPWSPLARGFLAGGRGQGGETQRAKTDQGIAALYHSESDAAIVGRVSELAQQRGVSNTQVALAWLLHQPGVSAPIVGSTKAHHLDQAVASAALTLAPDELTFLQELYQPHVILGH